MIASVTLDLPAGPAIGRTHQVVMETHVSNKLANLNLSAAKQKLRSHLDWQAELTHYYQVKVVMGDYNMALFHAVKYFRSRGMVVDVGAWYPWKSINIGPEPLKGQPSGKAMCDSCGILFFDTPGIY